MERMVGGKRKELNGEGAWYWEMQEEEEKEEGEV